MKLWMIEQFINKNYDTFYKAIVSAETKEDACKIHPNSIYRWNDEFYMWTYKDYYNQLEHEMCMKQWTEPKNVSVVCIGTAVKSMTPNTVICSSFVAG